MKRRKRKQRPVCPSCKIGQHTAELTTVVGMFQANHNTHFPNLTSENKITDQSFLDADFEWACDVCLESGKAVIAIPEKQVTSGFPHLAYVDTEYKCITCAQPFLFKKEEKQLWYEQLKFAASSTPDSCTDCRKTIRKQKVENKQLAALLKKPEANLTVEELQQVISIYKAWNKKERVANYKSLLKKLD